MLLLLPARACRGPVVPQMRTLFFLLCNWYVTLLFFPVSITIKQSVQRWIVDFGIVALIHRQMLEHANGVDIGPGNCLTDRFFLFCRNTPIKLKRQHTLPMPCHYSRAPHGRVE